MCCQLMARVPQRDTAERTPALILHGLIKMLSRDCSLQKNKWDWKRHWEACTVPEPPCWLGLDDAHIYLVSQMGASAAGGLTGGGNFLLCWDSWRKMNLSTWWPQDLHGGVGTSLPASVVASAAPTLGPVAPLLCSTRNKLGNFLGLLALAT